MFTPQQEQEMITMGVALIAQVQKLLEEAEKEKKAVKAECTGNNNKNKNCK